MSYSVPLSWSASAVTMTFPAASASATSCGRALPGPRMPTWTIRSTHGTSRILRMGLEYPSRTPRTSSRKVDVGIDVQKVDPAELSIRPHDDRRDRVVAADDERHRAGPEDGFDELRAPAIPREIARVTLEIAEVDDARALAARHERPSQVEVVMNGVRRRTPAPTPSPGRRPAPWRPLSRRRACRTARRTEGRGRRRLRSDRRGPREPRRPGTAEPDAAGASRARRRGIKGGRHKRSSSV